MLVPVVVHQALLGAVGGKETCVRPAVEAARDPWSLLVASGERRVGEDRMLELHLLPGVL